MKEQHIRDPVVSSCLPHQSTADTATPDQNAILFLQRHCGNAYVTRMLGKSAIQRQDAFAPVAAQAPNAEIPTAETQRPTLHPGEQGPDVIVLQRRLNLYGADLVEDGDFGPLTRQAVLQFQSVHAPPADGIVGPITWDALDKDPASPQDEIVPPDQVNAEGFVPGAGGNLPAFIPFPGITPQGVPQVVTPLTAMPVGRFAPHVAAGFIDRNIAALLNDLPASIPNGSFAADTTSFALQELGNGNLVGIVAQTNVGRLRPRLPAREHRKVDEIEQNGVRVATTFVFVSQGTLRGYIVVDDAEIGNAILPGAGRDSTQMILVHELNHHRNRKDSRGIPINAQEFVDVPLALQRQTPRSTSSVRERFIQEFTARHAEFIVRQERLEARGEPTQPLRFGQFFNAALDVATNERDRFDNGYMGTLAAADDPTPFRRQVAIWMRNLRDREFHSDPIQNGLTQQHFEFEFQFAQTNNFAPFAPDSNGLR